MDKILTIYTPTYNRKHLLPRLYESLKNQTNLDFRWLIIDDGSEDDTRSLVSDFINKGDIDIEYHYKENGGVHTAKNEACRYINTELMVFVPSDCIVKKDAVQKICDYWRDDKKNHSIGMIFHYENLETGEIIGGQFPENVTVVNGMAVGEGYRVQSDKVFVFKSSFYKQFLYPVFPDEKLFPDSWKLYMLHDAGYFHLINEILIGVEYTNDGYTKNLLKTMANSPKGYFEYNRIRLEYEKEFSVLVRATIHYIAFAKFCEKKEAFFITKRKGLYLLLYPMGVFWFYRLKRIREGRTSLLASKLLNLYRKGKNRK